MEFIYGMQSNSYCIVTAVFPVGTLKSCLNFDCVNGADIGIDIMYGFVSWFHRKIYNANRLINTDLFSEVILHVVSHFGLKLSNAQIINKLLFYLTFSIVFFSSVVVRIMVGDILKRKIYSKYYGIWNKKRKKNLNTSLLKILC